MRRPFRLPVLTLSDLPFQKRLRPLREISFRNLAIPEDCLQVQLKLFDSKGDLICDGGFLEASEDPHWKNLKIGGKPTSKGAFFSWLACISPFSIHTSSRDKEFDRWALENL